MRSANPNGGATGTGKILHHESSDCKLISQPWSLPTQDSGRATLAWGVSRNFPRECCRVLRIFMITTRPEAYAIERHLSKDSRGQWWDWQAVTCSISPLRAQWCHRCGFCLLYHGRLGSPKKYADSVVSLRPGLEISRDKLLNDLVDVQLERNDDFQRGKFCGDVVEIFSQPRVMNMPSGLSFGDDWWFKLASDGPSSRDVTTWPFSSHFTSAISQWRP